MWLYGCPCHSYKDFLLSVGLMLTVMLSRMGFLWSLFYRCVLLDRVIKLLSQGLLRRRKQGWRAQIQFSWIPVHELGPETVHATFLVSDWLPWSRLCCTRVNWLKQIMTRATLAAFSGLILWNTVHKSWRGRRNKDSPEGKALWPHSQ